MLVGTANGWITHEEEKIKRIQARAPRGEENHQAEKIRLVRDKYCSPTKAYSVPKAIADEKGEAKR